MRYTDIEHKPLYTHDFNVLVVFYYGQKGEPQIDGV